METWKEFFFFYLFCHLISSLYNIFLYSILASVCISIQQVKKNKNKNTGYTGNRARGFSTWFLRAWTACWTLLCLQAPWAPWLIGCTWLLQLCGLPWTSPCCRYPWGTFFTQPLLPVSRPTVPSSGSGTQQSTLLRLDMLGSQMLATKEPALVWSPNKPNPIYSSSSEQRIRPLDAISSASS